MYYTRRNVESETFSINIVIYFRSRSSEWLSKMTWLHFKSTGRLNFFVFCICFLFVCAGKQPLIIPGVLYEDSPIAKDFKAKGIKILTIPYLFGHVDIDFFTENLDNIFDQRRTMNCLKNKRILVLGDSVLEEFHIDISILLSGIGSNEKLVNNFIYFAGSKTPRGTFYRLPNKVLLYNHPNRRNITIISEESQTYLRHRFMGCLLYTSPSPRDRTRSRMPSSA